MALQHATLPNGTEVSCLNAFSVPDLHRQVQQYFRHGIAVKPGDTIVDAGANIGLFTLAIYEKCQDDASIYSFEPIPVIYEALSENSQRTDPVRIKTFNCGLSSENRTATFAYRPNMPTVSSAYGNDDSEMEIQIREALLENLDAAPINIRWVRILPPFARKFLLRKAMRTAFEGIDVNCWLRRLSDVIREENITRIDLLKIDVEKSELDVLEGIDDADWAKIQQVVMEIHDIDGRLEAIKSMLATHSITKVVVEQEDILRGSNVYALYAMRP